MADEKALEPIYIKKKLKANHAPHGGAWKVAYADFVTAMMAFFLLLWLLNATTDEQRQGISNYFEPETIISGDKSGSSGMFGGLAINAVGTLRSAGSPPSVSIPLPTAGGPKTRQGQGEAVLVSEEPNPESVNFEARKREEEEFNKAQADLRLAVEQSDEARAFQDSLLLDKTPEGLRIQLIDQERVAMFEAGSARFTPYFEALLEVVTRIVRRFPNPVEISGHTDAEPTTPDAAYTSWELSGERANAARRVMVGAGMNPDRIAGVVGRADSDPLFPADPKSPRNRRISILLVHQQPPATDG
ncbi:MAG: flagellar motor protein MotB [Alphaproteobacteria bacterium]